MGIESYKLHHPLPHGPISNTTWYVPISHYIVYLADYAVHGKTSKGRLFIKQK